MALKIPAAMQPSGMLTPVAMTRPNLRHSFTANDICSMDQTTKLGLPVPVVCPDKPAPTLRHLELPKPRPWPGSEEKDPGGTINQMGLPSILRRRLGSQSPATTVPGTPRSPRWTYADSGDTWTSFHGDRQLKPVQTPPAHSRNSILDFEHLFSQYFVQVRPSRLRGLWHSTALPSPEEVVDAWAEDTAAYIMRYADVCNVYWPQAQLQLPTLHERLLQELQWTVEWSSEKRYRVDITVYPERVCHRLLWAIGDAILPDKFLSHTQTHLQARWRDYRFRCSDGMLWPWGTFQLLFLLCSVGLLSCIRSIDTLWHAVYRGGFHDPSQRDEALDHLASRLLCFGALGHLWVFYMVAAFFPLRTLHSPFDRDLGSMAAYSNRALQTTRIFLPPICTAKLLALLVRFSRLGVPWSLSLSFHGIMLVCAGLLPILAISVCVALRSSFYSYYHASSILLVVTNGVVTIGFTSFLEVGWAVLLIAAALMAWLLLFAQYTTEFTKANLMKAAQIQWACVHVLVVLSLVLALALEVEAGFARRFVTLFCDYQTVVPVKVCRRLLSGYC
mmetsp:Transcript_93110/g.221468  ORF Transcript_93110/g.221468 Transcript_93110/m.221468 type:complete len:559 (-) Transcript_93110:99-1775(-)